MNLKYQSNLRKSIYQMIGASFCMSFTGVLIKYLIDIPLMEIVFFRSVPTVIILTLILKTRKHKLIGNKNYTLILRSFFGFFALSGFFYSVQNLVLADALIVKQLTPFFVVILSIIFLKEKVRKRQSIFFIISIIGALLVIKPGFRVFIFPVIIALLASFSSAAGHVAVRYLRLSENSLVIINYNAIASLLISFFYMLIKKEFVIPNFFNFFILISMGFISLLTQLWLTDAYRNAKASIVSIYLYMQIFFGIIFGILFFSEYLDYLTICGGGLIFLGGYLNYKLN